MKVFFTVSQLLLCCFWGSSIAAQNRSESPLKYALVRVYFSENHTIRELASLGLECDHGFYKRDGFLENVFSNEEIARIKAAGFSYNITIPDMAAYYLEHRNDPATTAQSRSVNCGPDDFKSQWRTPENYTYGSMGGYQTWNELLSVLDNMRAKFPNLISAKTPIDPALNTKEGRPIYWLRISDNPDVDESEPEVLYTALHHAREPNGLSQMLFFMWYLLENYETDPEIKALVNSTEFYFLPCVNPDGYVYNQTTNPQGGGYWRKNRGTNGGVDLNRNYGDHWGFDNTGSSPNASEDTYRGPSAFSEPETQAVKLFCQNHDFKVALNAHTFSNLLIIPYGYNSQPSPDNDAFVAISDLMAEQNHFNNGLSSETVGYAANGNSDDWMYVETPEKAKVLAMTAEIGPTDLMFWPPQSEIDALNKSMMWTNLTAARVVHRFGVAKPVIKPLAGYDNNLTFNLKRYGLVDGTLIVSLKGQTANVVATGNPKSFTLAPYNTAEDSISFSISNSIAIGDEIKLLLVVDNGVWTHTDTIKFIWEGNIQTGLSIIFEDAVNNMSNWTATGNWGTVGTKYVSAPYSITDSPNGNYPNSSNTNLTLSESIDLTSATAAQLSFFTRWNIEKDYDYVQILGSKTGTGNFVPLCGTYTRAGTSNQDAGQPLYDGVQNEWVEEHIDLNDFIGSNLWLRFQLVSDQYENFDGFYFDDLKVRAALPSTPVATPNSESPKILIYPNPASGKMTVRIPPPANTGQIRKITIYNSVGVPVQIERTDDSGGYLHLDVSTWPIGLYFIRVDENEKSSMSTVLQVIR